MNISFGHNFSKHTIFCEKKNAPRHFWKKNNRGLRPSSNPIPDSNTTKYTKQRQDN